MNNKLNRLFVIYAIYFYDVFTVHLGNVAGVYISIMLSYPFIFPSSTII